MMRRILMLLLCLIMTGTAAQATGLPVDLSVGMPLRPECCLEDGGYEDPTVSVKISTGSFAETRWWMADVTISDASQLRTMPAHSFTSTATMRGRNISVRANAVLAVDGDFFSIEVNKKGSYVLRQGTLYNEKLLGKSDVLLIDSAGDFFVAEKPCEGDIPEPQEGRRWVNGFCFGPILVRDGEPLTVEENGFMATDKPRARTAICQFGPLHYAAVCCSGPAKGSKGMTLQEFADLLGTLQVNCAYNLDGGNSTMMYRGDKMLNVNSSTRDISDILYFASAWSGEGE